MDLDKTSLIKTILLKLRVYIKSQPCESIINEFSEIFKKCQFLKLRKLSNELFFELDSSNNETNQNIDKINELIEKFRLNIVNSITENMKTHQNNNSSENNNICLSSDDDEEEEEEGFESQKSSNSSFELIGLHNNNESGDSDIEIIDAKEGTFVNGGSQHYNMRKRKVSSSNTKENVNITGGERNYKQSRYEFRERKPNNNSAAAEETTDSSQSQRNGTNNHGRSANNDKSGKNNEEVIQIEDSSSDEDVREIPCGESSSGNGGRQRDSFRNYFRQQRKPQPGFKVHMPSGGAATTDHPPTQADPSQLASIPFIVQFPTMRLPTTLFNGHLYISHNHKFSVKLQGIDPRNFRFEN